MAKNTIKGITVEIGGDTTQLGKALEDVNKKSRDLSGELGEINKLLKFDPGNADLLAQKQKVLADAVENTAEKLETLREAEKQVQKQFEKGEVSEEQVRKLKREIEATSQELQKYESAAEQTAKEVKNLGKESDNSEDDVDKLGKEAEETGDEIEGMGSKIGDVVKGGLGLLTGAVTAAVGAMVASAEASRDYRKEMGKLDTAFTTNGHTSEAAQETYKTLQGVLGETEQAVEAANHLAKLTDNEKDLATWTNIATGVYGTFGNSLPIEGLTEAANETAKTGALTGGLADALNWAGESEEDFQAKLDSCSTEQERQTLIMETLNGLYSDAADKYRETNAEIIRANEANEEWMAAMAGVGEAVEPVLTDVKLLGASLVSDLVPGVQQVAEAFRGIMNGEEGSAEALGTALTGIFTGLINKIKEIIPTVAEVAVSLVFTLTNSLLDQVTPLTRALMDILTKAISKAAKEAPKLVENLLNALFGFVDNIAYYLPDLMQAALDLLTGVIEGAMSFIQGDMPTWIFDLVTDITNALTSAIPMLLQGAITLFSAIVQAIPLIVDELAFNLEWVIGEITSALTNNIPVLLSGALQLFGALVQAIPQIMTSLLPQIPILVETIVNCLVENIPVLLEGAVQLLKAIVDAIPVIIEAIVPAVPAIVNGIVTALTTLTPVLLSAAIDLLFAIIDAIPQIINALLPEIPTIVDCIVDGLLQATPVLLDAAVQLFFALIEAIPQIVEALMGALPDILDCILSVLSAIPELIFGILLQALDKLVQWGGDMVREGGAAAGKVLTTIVDGVKNLPVKIWTWFNQTIEKVVKFGKDAGQKAKEAAKTIWDGIVNTFKDLPAKMAEIGTDLIKGLWNGIKDMTSWICDKLEGFGDTVLDGIKSFFGIKSPSRVFRDEVGKMLAAGLAEGIEDGADQPLDAMAALSNDILDEAGDLNGLTLERRLHNTFSTPTAPTSVETGLLARLDSILYAIERGQIITIDGETLVGATAGRMDSTLGQRRELVARGAI